MTADFLLAPWWLGNAAVASTIDAARVLHVRSKKNSPSAKAVRTRAFSRAPEFSLATTLVAAAGPVAFDPRVQLFVPQLKPPGQQPPSTLLPQVDHPDAQGPVGAPRIVTPLLNSIDVVCRGGHELVEQSRPILQQPPPG